MINLYIIANNKKLERLIFKLNKNVETIMADLQELKQETVALQLSVDNLQAKIETLQQGNAETVAQLQKHIDDLQALVDAAPTPDQLQEVVDALKATQADVDSTTV